MANNNEQTPEPMDQKFRCDMDGIQIASLMAVLMAADKHLGHNEEMKADLEVVKQLRFERIK